MNYDPNAPAFSDGKRILGGKDEVRCFEPAVERAVNLVRADEFAHFAP